jgi:hypothetical protein
MKRRPVALASIKAVHTLAWLSIESCLVYLFYAGLRRQSDRRAAVAAAVVTAESLIFAANGFRCPLTKLAVKFGAERGGVTDIFLPDGSPTTFPPSMCRSSSSRWGCT